MSKKVKPCYVCQGKRLGYHLINAVSGPIECVAWCKKCGIEGPEVKGDNYKDAKKAWNASIK